MVRNSVVQGMFYDSDPRSLEKEIRGYCAAGAHAAKKIDAIGCISPHAGYMYSGAVAAKVLSCMMPKSTYIILGPNHTGMGVPFGIDRRNWLTPFGEVAADQTLIDAILSGSKLCQEDTLCHNREHSIEVQLPILKVLNKDFTFVPIVIGGGGGREYKAVGTALAEAIRSTGRDVTIIASSDMTHYEPQEVAKKKDMAAVDRILAFDLEGFLRTIHELGISMCGYATAAIMLAAAKELGAKKATLVDYKTSGDTTGDYTSVVGYAGVIVYR
ncbi:MAG: AmmeMemoRadiSam system protein B [Candidatus Omnitrophica bacterium]|nr:AmmeMemoRadiSam system protein B [Candidatus Omnitrophota bacterium]